MGEIMTKEQVLEWFYIVCEGIRGEYVVGWRHRDFNVDKEALSNMLDEYKNKDNSIPYSICPINMYFEGEENICNKKLCDYEEESRGCSEKCRKL